MKFDPGVYYIGDPGFVLPSEDLRMMFSEILRNGKIDWGFRELVSSRRQDGLNTVWDLYWAANLPYRAGTLYDQTGKSWGFDWGVFGCLPFKWIESSGTHDDGKVEFEEPFECLIVDDKIKIGHLIFSSDPL